MASEIILTDPLMMPIVNFMAISSEFEATESLAILVFLFDPDFIIPVLNTSDVPDVFHDFPDQPSRC